MVLPLLLIMVLPKLMNAADPEAQKVKKNFSESFFVVKITRTERL